MHIAQLLDYNNCIFRSLYKLLLEYAPECILLYTRLLDCTHERIFRHLATSRNILTHIYIHINHLNISKTTKRRRHTVHYSNIPMCTMYTGLTHIVSYNSYTLYIFVHYTHPGLTNYFNINLWACYPTNILFYVFTVSFIYLLHLLILYITRCYIMYDIVREIDQRLIVYGIT